MKLFVQIQTEADLLQQWSDELVPNMSFGFIETDIDECLEIEGRIYASYTPLIAAKDKVKTYHDTELGTVKYELKAGIYGLHDTHKNLTQLELSELTK